MGGLGDISFSSSVRSNGNGNADGDASALDVSGVRLQALKDLSEDTIAAKGRSPRKVVSVGVEEEKEKKVEEEEEGVDSDDEETALNNSVSALKAAEALESSYKQMLINTNDLKEKVETSFKPLTPPMPSPKSPPKTTTDVLVHSPIPVRAKASPPPQDVVQDIQDLPDDQEIELYDPDADSDIEDLPIFANNVSLGGDSSMSMSMGIDVSMASSVR